MAKWAARGGAAVRVADTRVAPPRLEELRRTLPAATAECGPLREASFRGVDLIAISPGLSPSEPLVHRAASAGIPVVGDIELFAQALSGRAARIIAVTGTNGKSTVTALSGSMARAAGADCEIAGNIGPPALEALMSREDAGCTAEVWVLELSSFQLETTRSLAADAATVLNITEDHLDRYPGIDDYARAKARIFSGDGVQVLNRDDRRSLAMALPERKSITFGLEPPARAQDWGVVERDGEPWLAQGDRAILRARELRLAGTHNVANALAALALCSAMRLPLPPLVAALRTFKGLPHRVEPVGEAAGVSWFNDSKGTNVGSTVAALAGLVREGSKVVLVAGGEGKGQDFSPLKDAVARSARALVLIGRDAPLIEAAVAGAGVAVRRASSMEEAVELAARAALPGDAVLLSPACASFDMFRDYRHRGDVFRLAVEKVTHASKH